MKTWISNRFSQWWLSWCVVDMDYNGIKQAASHYLIPRQMYLLWFNLSVTWQVFVLQNTHNIIQNTHNRHPLYFPYLHPAWISNLMPSKVWEEFIYPFLQQKHHWSLGMDYSFHHIYYNGCNYLSMLGFKLIHFSKTGPWSKIPLF